MAKTTKLPVQRFAWDLFEHVVDDEKINTLAKEYREKYPSTSDAAKQFIKDYSKQTNCLAVIEQVSTLTNIPELAGASVGFVSLIYWQLYIVCGVAALAGEDIHSNTVKTQCIECITINAVSRALRPLASKSIDLLLKRIKINGVDKLVDGAVEFILDWSAIKLVSRNAYSRFFRE